jgi:hypothetical protein
MESRRGMRNRSQQGENVEMIGTERPENAFALIFFEICLAFGCIQERRPAPIKKRAIDLRPVTCKRIIRKFP